MSRKILSLPSLGRITNSCCPGLKPVQIFNMLLYLNFSSNDKVLLFFKSVVIFNLKSGEV